MAIPNGVSPETTVYQPGTKVGVGPFAIVGQGVTLAVAVALGARVTVGEAGMEVEVLVREGSSVALGVSVGGAKVDVEDEDGEAVDSLSALASSEGLLLLQATKNNSRNKISNCVGLRMCVGMIGLFRSLLFQKYGLCTT